MKSPTDDLTLDDLSWMLGKDPIRFPQPIVTPVRQVHVTPKCPCCGWRHPSDESCKELERLDYSGR